MVAARPIAGLLAFAAVADPKCWGSELPCWVDFAANCHFAAHLDRRAVVVVAAAASGKTITGPMN